MSHFPKQDDYAMRNRVMDSMLRLLCKWINVELFKDKSEQEVQAIMTDRIGRAWPMTSMLMSSDLPIICHAAGLDLGLSVRSPSGDVITFWPQENFGSPQDKGKVR